MNEKYKTLINKSWSEFSKIIIKKINKTIFLFAEIFLLSSIKPIIKKVAEHNKNGKNNFSLEKSNISEVFKYLVAIIKIINAKLNPKKSDIPPILTFGLLWIFILLGWSRKLNFFPNSFTFGMVNKDDKKANKKYDEVRIIKLKYDKPF